MRTWFVCSFVLAALGIAGIVSLEHHALSKGINGVALTSSISAIVVILTGVPVYFFGRSRGTRNIREICQKERPSLYEDLLLPKRGDRQSKDG